MTESTLETKALSDRARSLQALGDEVRQALKAEPATLADIDELREEVDNLDFSLSRRTHAIDVDLMELVEGLRKVAKDADSPSRGEAWLWVAVLVIFIWQIVDVVIRYV